MPPPRQHAAAQPRRAAKAGRSASAAPRPRASGLDRESIVAAALGLADREGLPALTARALARELGCQPMSLYHHVPSMDELLDAMADRLLHEAGAALPARPRDVAALLGAVAARYLALATGHPRTFALVSSRRLRGTGARKALEALLTGLGALGVRRRAALTALRILVAYLNGAGMALAAWELDPDAEGPRVDRDLRSGVELLVAALARRLDGRADEALV